MARRARRARGTCFAERTRRESARTRCQWCPSSAALPVRALVESRRRTEDGEKRFPLLALPRTDDSLSHAESLAPRLLWHVRSPAPRSIWLEPTLNPDPVPVDSPLTRPRERNARARGKPRRGLARGPRCRLSRPSRFHRGYLRFSASVVFTSCILTSVPSPRNARELDGPSAMRIGREGRREGRWGQASRGTDAKRRERKGCDLEHSRVHRSTRGRLRLEPSDASSEVSGPLLSNDLTAGRRRRRRRGRLGETAFRVAFVELGAVGKARPAARLPESNWK